MHIESGSQQKVCNNVMHFQQLEPITTIPRKQYKNHPMIHREILIVCQLRFLQEQTKRDEGEFENEGHNLFTPNFNHNIEQAFCALFFFFFVFGGWRTTLMAASNTAFTFCSNKNHWILKLESITTNMKHENVQHTNVTCWVFELHSM